MIGMRKLIVVRVMRDERGMRYESDERCESDEYITDKEESARG